jgi:hypothetical protein
MIAGCNGDLYLGGGSSASRLLRVFAGRAGAWERRAAGFGAVARWVVAAIGVSPAVSGGECELTVASAAGEAEEAEERRAGAHRMPTASPGMSLPAQETHRPYGRRRT